jgi:hypothetical protein
MNIKTDGTEQVDRLQQKYLIIWLDIYHRIVAKVKIAPPLRLQHGELEEVKATQRQ